MNIFERIFKRRPKNGQTGENINCPFVGEIVVWKRSEDGVLRCQNLGCELALGDTGARIRNYWKVGVDESMKTIRTCISFGGEQKRIEAMETEKGIEMFPKKGISGEADK